MYYVGIDLSGPANKKDTSLAVFCEIHKKVVYKCLYKNVSDCDIFEIIGGLVKQGKVNIAIDAPLSYQDGGGDRAQDKELRKVIKDLGMKSGSIMPPTLTKMVYITLRGMYLASLLKNEYNKQIEIVEVHPGAVLAFRLTPSTRHLLAYKQCDNYYEEILQHIFFLHESGLETKHIESNHDLDACLAAFACYEYKERRHKWIYPAQPPFHRYPLIC
ncbi:DUF429 domain-containing protein [Bacillus sp. HMF5848]|uniref:DUF429 domain-containing protein n=1 Tax=Bacillus sp. HMF5848 TaxID=2495421 RepID=UPI000F77B413|nr:DUF429 domain-containing protein [Bacillus sp. HMF5848]RSK26829.1 DUF429 domain-containing protein [Bacillus sp. HMF5848]